jgi:hypothetical protein
MRFCAFNVLISNSSTSYLGLYVQFFATLAAIISPPYNKDEDGIIPSSSITI